MATIALVKEQQVTETPLVIFECLLPDGGVERWSTHRVQVGAFLYQPRVLGHNLFEIRAGSEEAVDSITRIGITLANSDSYLSQLSRNPGWKGAKITASFLFFDLVNDSPATETMVLFRGLVNPPDEITEAIVRLSLTSRLNLQRIHFPQVRIQRRCPWAFPSDLNQRTEAVSGGLKGKYSPFFSCGYSADVAGGRGNLAATLPFTSCDYTRGQCVERGMFSTDSQGRATRRFGGIEFVPPSTLVRGHGDAAWHTAAIQDNHAKYNDFVPLTYGTAWVQPPVVSAHNDGNLTRMEVLLGQGEVSSVIKVIVNDVDIPAAVSGEEMTGTGWYSTVSKGAATGDFNLDFADGDGAPLGDPYGGMAFISVVVPNRVSEGKTLPKVQVLLDGLKLPIYAGNGTYLGEEFSRNPAWILLDILRRSGWTADEIEIASFAAAAAYCDEAIPATDLYGNPVSIPRFACSLALRRRRSAADVVRGVRACAGLFLAYGPEGKLRTRVEEKLSVQQPTKPAFSNATEALDGGWPAYEFGDGTQGISGIARRPNGEASVRLWYRSAAETPNRYTVEFQDEFNEYQQDSLSLVDVNDAVQSGQEISAVMPALGLPNFHQAARLIRRQLDKSLRGNLFIQFETSVKGVGLQPGDLITVTYLKEGLLRQPFRIQRIAPGINHRSVLIEAQIHDDTWYRDDSLEGGEVGRRQGVWGTGVPRPLVGSTIDARNSPQFGVEELHDSREDGTVAVSLRVSFQPPAKPVRTGVQIPHLSLAPVVETTGGTLRGAQNYYYAISALSAASQEGQLSFVVRASIPSGTNTNRVTLQQLRFSPGSTTFNVYRGVSPSELLMVANAVTIGNSFTDDGLPVTLISPPDENFDRARFEWRFELHPEVSASESSEYAIGSTALQLLPNEFAGKVVRITYGKGARQERVIESHTATSITVAARWDVIPDTSSSFVIAEPGWRSGASGIASPVQFEVLNRNGATVHISGVAVNARGVESSRELSPVTRWQIGGAGAGALDADVPPAASFGLAPTGRGGVEVVGIGFGDLENTHGIRAGTLTVHYWDELQGQPTDSLASSIDDQATELEVVSGTYSPGDLVQLESEVMEVDDVNGAVCTVRRGAYNSFPAGHAAGTAVFVLDRRVHIIPFPRNFFGSPASGSFSYPVGIPNSRIACADLMMANDRGNGETAKVAFTNTLDRGVRTYSGGQFSIQVDGYLAIQDAAAPPLVVERPHSIRDVFAVVREAPTGAAIEMELRQDGAALCTLTIGPGATASEVVDGFGLPALQAMSKLTLAITAIGAGGVATPGKDLTVTVRL